MKKPPKQPMKISATKAFLPLVIFLFLINVHYYQWYAKGFGRAAKLLSGKNISDRYERTQSAHPYKEIQDLAREFEGQEDRVHFVFHHQDESNLDYTSTYLANKARPAGEPTVTKHLNELGLFVNYYFYPAQISVWTVDDLLKEDIDVGDVIISDVDFESLAAADPRLQEALHLLSLSQQVVSHKEPIVPNRQSENTYFIYRVEQ